MRTRSLKKKKERGINNPPQNVTVAAARAG
jgi:hypothetical protein